MLTLRTMPKDGSISPDPLVAIAEMASEHLAPTHWLLCKAWAPVWVWGGVANARILDQFYMHQIMYHVYLQLNELYNFWFFLGMPKRKADVENIDHTFPAFLAVRS